MQKLSRWILLIIILASSGMAPGCSIIKPQPDRSQFFMLVATAKPDPAAKNSKTVKSMWVGIGPISIPAFLKHSEVMIQLNPTQVEPSQWNRWAEPLDKNIPRIVSQNLTALLDNNNLMKYPWYAHEAPDYQVEINILNFIITSDHKIQLSVQWEVMETQGQKREWNQKTDITIPSASSDMATLVGTMSEALTVLSQDIAAKLREVAALNA